MHGFRPLLGWRETHAKDAATTHPQDLLVILTAMLAVVIALIAAAFPVPLMPGVFGAMALVVAVVVAGVAWWLSVERTSGRLTLWEVAEAFALIGIVALMLGRSDQALQMLGVPG